MKKNQYRIISCLMSLVLVLSVIPHAFAASFSDVQKSHAFYDEINYLVKKGIINGFANGSFKPNQVVTRGQAAIMISRTLGLNGTKRDTVFSDVKKNNGASGYIQSAVDAGIIQGYPDGTFRPNESVSRGQMAIFICRAFDLDRRIFITFSDVSRDMTAYPYIEKVVAARIANGYANHTFKPNKAITRGEFSAFMARALEPSFKVPVSDFYKDMVGEGLSAICISIASEEEYNIIHTKRQKGYTIFTIEDNVRELEDNIRLIIHHDEIGIYSVKVDISKDGPVTEDEMYAMMDVFLRSINNGIMITEEDMDELTTYFEKGVNPFKFKGLIFNVEANHNNGLNYLAISAAYDD